MVLKLLFVSNLVLDSTKHDTNLCKSTGSHMTSGSASLLFSSSQTSPLCWMCLKYNIKIYNTYATLYFIRLYHVIIPATCCGPIVGPSSDWFLSRCSEQLIMISIYGISYCKNWLKKIVVWYIRNLKLKFRLWYFNTISIKKY